MKKIIFVVPSISEGGGVPAVAKFLVKVAKQSGKYKVEVVSLSMASKDVANTSVLKPLSWLKSPSIRTVSWFGFKVPHVGARLGEIEIMRYLPRKEVTKLIKGADIVQVVAGSPSWAVPLIHKGPPVSLQVATLTSVERVKARSLNTGMIGLVKNLFTMIVSLSDRVALKNVQSVQVENKWMHEYVKKLRKNSEQHIHYAPPGVDTAVFKPSPSRLNNRPYLLSVGRLADPRKNSQLLARAFSVIASQFPSIQLITAGGSRPGSDFDDVISRAGVGSQVIHIDRPSTEELVKLYQQATVFILSSDEEGFGVVVIEAMSCGVPVVATRCGGPEGIIENGIDGFLVEKDSPSEMAAAALSLLTNLELNRKMGIEASSKVERCFSELAAGENFLKIWEGMTENSEAKMGSRKCSQ